MGTMLLVIKESVSVPVGLKSDGERKHLDSCHEVRYGRVNTALLLHRSLDALIGQIAEISV